ncbi:alpha/beta fold hydrolase [soil metagenome]
MPDIGVAQLLSRIAATADFPQPPLVRTRYPVVLLHGFGAIASLFKMGMLHRQAMHMRSHGVRAYAPHVNPYDTTSIRSEAWTHRLTHILEECDAEKINLIGFSSGGLDARFIGGLPEWRDRIASIITISSPNHGSPLASYLLEKNDVHRKLALQTMEAVGRSAYNVPPRIRPALAEMTPEYVMEVFNTKHPIPEGIYCASYAGAAGKGTNTPMISALAVLNLICYEKAGVNDGYVPMDSAWWSERLGVVPADHAQIIGATVFPSRFDTDGFFLSVVRHLAEINL